MIIEIKGPLGERIEKYRLGDGADRVTWNAELLEDPIAKQRGNKHLWSWCLRDHEGEMAYLSGMRFQNEHATIRNIKRVINKNKGRHFHPLACDREKITDQELCDQLAKLDQSNLRDEVLTTTEFSGIQKYIDMVSGIRRKLTPSGELAGIQTYDEHRHLAYLILSGHVKQKPMVNN